MPTNSTATPAPPKENLKAHRVLIVEDDVETRSLIRLYLKKLGIFNPMEAEDAPEALRLLEAETVDLIISDLYMPGMSGLDFFRKLHEDERLKDIPFLMITADASKSKILEAMTMGIRNYVIKPVDAENLMAKLRRLLKISLD